MRKDWKLCGYVNEFRSTNAFSFTNVTKAGANLYFKDKFAADNSTARHFVLSGIIVQQNRGGVISLKCTVLLAKEGNFSLLCFIVIKVNFGSSWNNKKSTLDYQGFCYYIFFSSLDAFPNSSSSKDFLKGACRSSLGERLHPALTGLAFR